MAEFKYADAPQRYDRLIKRPWHISKVNVVPRDINFKLVVRNK